MMFEDFVPIDDGSVALITEGNSSTSLTMISKINFTIEGSTITLGDNIETIVTGSYLRLGNVVDNILYYSDGAPCRDSKVMSVDLKTKKTNEITSISGVPVQPFYSTDGKFYYSDEAPTAKIFCNNDLYVDHYEDFVEVGNPFIDNDIMYYEARRADRPAPGGWELWKINMTTKQQVYICDGANPSIFENDIFYGKWIDNRFDIFRMKKGNI